MSDDSFFREVDEELRQDRVHALWKRYGRLVIGGAVAVVVIASVVVIWERYETRRANEAGDRFIAASDLASAGNADEAEPALQSIIDEGYGVYPVLARMRLAAVHQKAGAVDKALAEYKAVEADSSATQAVRDMAAVRAGYILVDTGSLDDVRGQVERLTSDADPLRGPAREALALASWKAGDVDDAKLLFQQLADDGSTPRGIVDRAHLMLDVIAAGDTSNGEVTPADSTSAAPAEDATAAPDTAPPAVEPAAGDEAAPASALPDEPASAPDETESGSVTEGTVGDDAAETPPGADGTAADAPAGSEEPASDATSAPAPESQAEPAEQPAGIPPS
ncbi:tetratricopeptide repeat protein [Consotaella aegiceratis]|uniref:tetratricopeptide repeat protein n=1 Tax=Consotaella aegiceratis TaxID=3097961 RepID=UPI002F3F7EAA